MSEALSAYVQARTVEDGDCLRWTGYVHNGHPEMHVNGFSSLTRRFIYEQAHGPVPKGRVMRCVCETPLCVREDHCVPMTYKSIAKQCGALGKMSGPVRSARIAAAKRAGRQAKITQDDARAIRVSTETSTVLARRYGLSVAVVCRIKRGEVRREFGGNVWAGLAA